ncbi:single-stranded-DNA-specific exonuclease RecJ [Putridiphycobacter roseus]|uniref:Single-stranded-DNA-specific exonuclease RecJ n=1 Tax=Putridiphycobacter roseus TaxID=2219161 RepID=A0A2W1NDY3_9FLAO|nr:single-stranded-DNA-specific exonuclease RecJ [Putridiphycobacter roseus]PZE16276.1 single-stranded-DNA-specific exonuclease RecJ [Putridiphycobacter roseus]
MENNWNYSEFEENDQLIDLIEALDVSKTIGELLINRGIDSFDKAKKFFRPDIEELHNPFLMKGMDEAVIRIQDAIDNNENILIYGDYDVDGTTSVALMFQYLRNFTKNLHYYIPDRYKEGYGVSNIGVDFAIDNNFSLVIALDCGIKAVDKVERAKTNDVDFIICDHHTPGEILPNAIILNPKQKGCTYPFKELCGCGVGFKLAQALNDSFALPFSEVEHLLDLVMVAIGADMVSVMGENRILAYHGLKKLNQAPRIGFSVLLELAGKQTPLTVTDVVFTLAPRINAAGRIKSGNKAVELLLATTMMEAQSIGKEINEYNTTRRLIEKDITEEALTMISSNVDEDKQFTTVLYNDTWHKGVVGIVASRVIEKYYKPTIILTESNGMAVGSVRSVENINVYEALCACEEHIEQFGGHMYAAGLTLRIEKIDDFRVAFNEAVKIQSDAKRKIPKIAVEAEIDFRDIFLEEQNSIPKFYRILKQFAPFGPDNMNPIFRTNMVRPVNSPKILKEAHLKIKLVQDDIEIDAIGFNFQDQFKYLDNKVFNVVYHLEENRWKGKSNLQLILKDLKPYS